METQTETKKDINERQRQRRKDGQAWQEIGHKGARVAAQVLLHLDCKQDWLGAQENNSYYERCSQYANGASK